jgi:hypothetical protein
LGRPYRPNTSYLCHLRWHGRYSRPHTWAAREISRLNLHSPWANVSSWREIECPLVLNWPPGPIKYLADTLAVSCPSWQESRLRRFPAKKRAETKDLDGPPSVWRPYPLFPARFRRAGKLRRAILRRYLVRRNMLLADRCLWQRRVAIGDTAANSRPPQLWRGE